VDGDNDYQYSIVRPFGVSYARNEASYELSKMVRSSSLILAAARPGREATNLLLDVTRDSEDGDGQAKHSCPSQDHNDPKEHLPEIDSGK
jgi:hypothetical protein